MTKYGHTTGLKSGRTSLVLVSRRKRLPWNIWGKTSDLSAMVIYKQKNSKLINTGTYS